MGGGAAKSHRFVVRTSERLRRRNWWRLCPRPEGDDGFKRRAAGDRQATLDRTAAGIELELAGSSPDRNDGFASRDQPSGITLWRLQRSAPSGALLRLHHETWYSWRDSGKRP